MTKIINLQYIERKRSVLELLYEYIQPTEGKFFKKINPGEVHKFCPFLEEIETIQSNELFAQDTRTMIEEFTKKQKCNRLLCRIVVFLSLKPFCIHSYDRVTNL